MAQNGKLSSTHWLSVYAMYGDKKYKYNKQTTHNLLEYVGLKPVSSFTITMKAQRNDSICLMCETSFYRILHSPTEALL